MSTTEVVVFSDSEEYAELFMSVYKKLSEDNQVPHLDDIYHLFYSEWLVDVSNFLCTNKEAYQLTDKELSNIEEYVESLNFECPSYKQVHAYINLVQMSYRTDYGVFNEAVESVW